MNINESYTANQDRGRAGHLRSFPGRVGWVLSRGLSPEKGQFSADRHRKQHASRADADCRLMRRAKDCDQRARDKIAGDQSGRDQWTRSRVEKRELVFKVHTTLADH